MHSNAHLCATLHPDVTSHEGTDKALANTIIDRANMTLPSELSSVERVEETAEKFAQRAGFDEDTVSHIAMVAREAAVNAVIHGNKYDKNKQVGANFELTDDALTIQISDQGEGLDPDNCPDPLAPENLMRTSGRGIFLMRALMDEVHFRQLTPGTQITMVKRRAQKEIEA
jgi:serine/threonine-protein kinase RsbW